QFSHCIVPWVVEREFSGRLIYAGGDDLLCIVPADEALDLTARLQQLFSAAWVVDTGAPKDLDQWAWRRRDWQGTYDQTAARGRFVIPLPGEGGDSAIRLCRDGQRVAAHPADAALLPDSMRVDGRLLPMLGRAASLSAGIAIAHYKTPLSVLLRRSRELLDLAKEPYRDNEAPPHVAWRGRRGLALGHASRGGEKTRFALPWSSGEAGAIDAQRNLKLLAQAFGEGRLPGRLPYKLRELALTARCALERVAEQNQSADAHAQAHKMLLGGLLRQCLEGDGSEEIFAAALSIWQQGIDLACGDEGRYTDGLLLCRQLGRGESGADDEGDQ
ncbi:MAG: hypothetical protein JNM98_04015, partial [Rhodocyclaceae bacterium]|nr:hypothetical protein [Rhodocyclaceae bacterium]